jgi:hypothetical protein
MEFFKKHSNLSEDENSAAFPKLGIIQELISRGQHALETNRNPYSTYTFKGWKVIFSYLFLLFLADNSYI